VKLDAKIEAVLAGESDGAIVRGDALADLYPGWTVRECIRNKSMSLQNSRGGKPDAAPEVLVLNGPSLAPPSGLFGAEGGAI